MKVELHSSRPEQGTAEWAVEQLKQNKRIISKDGIEIKITNPHNKNTAKIFISAFSGLAEPFTILEENKNE